MDISTPDWVKHAVFYQIFPDRFARTQRDRQTLPPTMQVPLEPWDVPPSFYSYKGGDLWGVAEHLDYLQDLGVTALYFTPIFQSASNHRYHTHDYYRIDPMLGGDEAFENLLQSAHDRNIRIVLDGVFNHASRGFFQFNDILENGEQSPWLDWFRIEGWPLAPYDSSKIANYRGWWDMRALPVFNHDNPQVREYIMRVGEHWIRRGIDGWRLDVPGEVKTPGFWQEFRDRIKAINPEAYIVGEIWDDASQWLDGTQFDGVMNYPFTGPTLAFVAGDRVQKDLVEGPGYYPYPAIDAVTYSQKIQELLQRYPWEIQLTQLNLLSSHDIARALSVVNEDQASMALATLLLLTFPGAPSIYYGDEIGLTGGLDPDCRRGFPWQGPWNQSMLDMHKRLIQLRKQHKALCLGHYRVLAAEGMALVFERHFPVDSVVDSVAIAADRRLIAINADEQSVSLTLPQVVAPGQQLLFGQGDFRQQGDDLMLSLPPRSGLIL